MSGLNFKRIQRICKRYGLHLPIDITKWEITKFRFCYFANRLDGVNYKVFALRSRKHEIIYNGDTLLESQAVLAGKREVLFYQEGEEKNLDIKYQWEVNRMHHLLPVAVEISKSKNNALINFLKNEVVRYADSNYLSNTNAMEIAIALINIVYACQIADCKEILESNEICRIVKESFQYILRNIEKGITYSNNHYFFDLLGIVWAISELKENALFQSLKDFVNNEFLQLLSQIINKDGSLFEGSTYYSRYVTESLLEYVFTHEQERELHADIISKMASFLCDISDKGTIFGIGDNDSGRLLPLPDYFMYSSRSFEIIKLLCENLSIEYCGTKEKFNFDYFGISVIHKSKYVIAFRCDSIIDKKKNKHIGSHYHNDQLSIQMNINGEELLIDPGTYLYIKNNNRRISNMKTEVHNTLVVNGIEQNVISNNWRYVERRAIGTIVTISKSVLKASLCYEGIIHTRKINFAENGIDIIDDLVGAQNASLNFLFAPNLILRQINPTCVRIENKSYWITMSSNCEMRVCDAYCSYEYGEKIKTKRVQIGIKKSAKTSIYFKNKGEVL